MEDHLDTRLSMQNLLRRSRHEVRSTGLAAEALIFATKEKFDVAVVDIGLPDRSGIELMRELHLQHGLIGIATSGYGAGDEPALSPEEGFRYHFTKPVSMGRLRELLEELRVQKNARQQPAS